jgi:hypothetical protein
MSQEQLIAYKDVFPRTRKVAGTAMQHCEYCGSELRANARFCGHCGQKISSETEVKTNSSDAPIEDRTISSPATSTSLSELQNPASENDVVEEEQGPHFASENNVEEERTPHDNLGSTGSLADDLELEPEPEKYVDQPIGEHSRHAQTPSGKLEALSPGDDTHRRGPTSRSIPKLLLILLAGIIVAAGVVAALIGLFQWHLPGTGSDSNTLSISSASETVRTSGPALTASICVKSSTPSTSGTSGGIGLTLFAASGCSSIIAATASSLCVTFPYDSGASHTYIFDVSNATIDSKAYHLVLGIAEFTGPATYNDAMHITVGISEGSTGQNFSWLYHSGKVTINSDEQSGTMDVILESASRGNTIHVVGGWTCGHLIKNP